MTMSSIALGTLRLQPGRQLLADGVPLAIGRKPLELLSALAAARGDLVTKDELMDAVWPGMVVEENALQAQIAALRKLLGDEASRLQTVRGFGYRLDVCEEAETAPALPRLAAASQPAIAVLPFVNLSDDPEMDYLGDGLAEEIISSLARTRALSVPARTSTFAYKNRNRDIRAIARELGVDFVLEGSVRRSAGRIRLTAQLIEAEQGFHLWAENYDCQPDDMIAIQDAIAQAIASRLQAELLAKPATADSHAFDLCLRARSLLDRGSADNLVRSIALFEEAVARDPGYADARTGLSRALVHGCSRGALPVAGYRDALAHALDACRLDPGNAGAHGVAGCSWARMGDWLKSGDYLQRSIALHEQDADLHCVYGGGFLVFVGDIEGAVRHTRRARELAPASAVTHFASALSAHLGGDHEGMARHLADALEFGFPDGVQPIPAVRASDAFTRGDRAAATRHAIQTWRDVIGPDGWELLPAIYGGEPHRRGEAIDGFRALLERSEREGWPAQHGVLPHLLNWAVVLEEPELVRAVAAQALEAFRRTGVLEIGVFVPIWVDGDPSYLEDRGLKTIFEAVGLQAYWDSHGPPQFACERRARTLQES